MPKNVAEGLTRVHFFDADYPNIRFAAEVKAWTNGGKLRSQERMESVAREDLYIAGVKYAYDRERIVFESCEM